jgi:hypothetical protein
VQTNGERQVHRMLGNLSLKNASLSFASLAWNILFS